MWLLSFCYDFQTQTATSTSHGSSTVNEQRLADSLRGLADRMERELNVGTTTVFRFRDWFRSILWCSLIWYCLCLPITNAAMPTTLCNSFVIIGRILINFFNSCDHKAAVPFIRPITSNINEIKPDKKKERMCLSTCVLKFLFACLNTYRWLNGWSWNVLVVPNRRTPCPRLRKPIRTVA